MEAYFFCTIIYWEKGDRYHRERRTSMPIFTWFLVAGIFVSAYMTIKSIREDREVDEEWIEKEGNVYIERMNEEKKKKALVQ